MGRRGPLTALNIVAYSLEELGPAVLRDNPGAAAPTWRRRPAAPIVGGHFESTTGSRSTAWP